MVFHCQAEIVPFIVCRWLVNVLFFNEISSFENLLFTILWGHILYMECPFGHSNGTTHKAQLSSKNRRTEAVFI